MKVGIDISAAIYGTGVSNYTLELLHHLPKESMVPFGYSLRRFFEIKEGVALPLPPSVMDFLWNRLHVVNVEIFIGQVDVYHSSDWTQGPSKCKKVTTIHDLSPFLFPEETDPKIVSVHTRRMKWVVAECDKIICVSNSTAEDLKRLFPATTNRIVVIPEALPSKYLAFKPHITKESNYILAIGSRQPRKNIDRLRKACELLHLKLVILGETSMNQLTNNQVTYTGYVSDQDLVNYLANASVFVYPSLYEGFGLPILEAFNFMAPVACSNIPSFLEVAGDAAVYFDPSSEDSIATGITEALANKSKLISAGTKQLAKFSWAKTASQTLEVYKSLC